MRSVVKILAVDDEPSIAASMHFIFSAPRYEIASAQDGDVALERVAADPNPYDVVIADNNMPHVTGVELVRELRKRNFAGKIMILSAHLSSDLRHAYEEMDVDVMIDKPFDIHELRKALDSLSA